MNKFAGERLVAEVLDLVFNWILVAMPMNIMVFIGITFKVNDSIVSTILVYIALILGIVIYFLYNILPLVKGGSTFGYKIVKLKVVDQSGSAVSVKKAFIRTVLKLILSIFMFTYIPMFIFAFILFKTGGEENLLDKVVKTKAVRI